MRPSSKQRRPPLAGIAEGTRLLIAASGVAVLAEVEQLRPGDLVMTHRGRFRRVAEVQTRPYRGSIVALERRGCGATLWLAPEHQVATPLPSLPAAEVDPATARQLRRRPTPSEERLWALLRGAALGPRFRRQHILGPFVIDFYCPALRLAVEVDGAVHDEPDQRARDRARQDAMEQYGVTFVRVRSGDAERRPEGVVARIAAAVTRREALIAHELLWVSAGLLRTGQSVYHTGKLGLAEICRAARGRAATSLYTVVTDGDESLVTEVCTLRGLSLKK